MIGSSNRTFGVLLGLSSRQAPRCSLLEAASSSRRGRLLEAASSKQLPQGNLEAASSRQPPQGSLLEAARQPPRGNLLEAELPRQPPRSSLFEVASSQLTLSFIGKFVIRQVPTAPGWRVYYENTSGNCPFIGRQAAPFERIKDFPGRRWGWYYWEGVY